MYQDIVIKYILDSAGQQWIDLKYTQLYANAHAIQENITNQTSLIAASCIK